METNQVIIFLLTIVFIVLLSNSYLPSAYLNRLESNIKNIDEAFDNNRDTHVVIKDKLYILVSLLKREYLSSIGFVFNEEVLKEDISLKISISKDYVNWNSKNILIKSGEKLANYEIDLNLILGQFIKLEFDCTGLKKPLILEEVKINRSLFPEFNINNIKIIKIGENYAQIYWETDIETVSQIRYGIKNTDNLATEMIYRKKHILELKNLLKGTKYYFNIIAISANKKLKKSELLDFITEGIPLPLFNNIRIENIDWSRAEFFIRSNIPLKIKIEYGTSQNKFVFSKRKKSGMHKENNLFLDNLKPLKRYYYHIKGTDQFGNKIEKTGSFISAEKNIALGKKVHGTFNEKSIKDKFSLEGDVIGRITDGSLHYQTGMAVSGDPMEKDQFFIIDLGDEEHIDKILLYFRALCYPEKFSISIAKKENEWELLEKNINAGYGTNGLSESGDPLKIVALDADGKKARFIKFYMEKGSPYYKKYDFYNFIQVFEAKVYPVCN